MIKQLNNISILRSYNGISKVFSGNVYCNLEDYRTIYYEVNGDFYNNGTISVSAGLNIEIGESGSVSFGVTGSSNHFKYFYSNGRIYPVR